MRFEGQIKTFPAKETTTRKFYDQGDTSPIAWDGSNAVSADFRDNTYAPGNRKVINACRHPVHLAGLKKSF